MISCDDCTQHAKVERILDDFKECQEKKTLLWDAINSKLSTNTFYAMVTILLSIWLAVSGYISYQSSQISTTMTAIQADVAVNKDNIEDLKHDLTRQAP